MVVTGDVHCALMMTLAAKHRALVRSPSPEPPVAHKNTNLFCLVQQKIQFTPARRSTMLVTLRLLDGEPADVPRNMSSMPVALLNLALF